MINLYKRRAKYKKVTNKMLRDKRINKLNTEDWYDVGYDLLRQKFEYYMRKDFNYLCAIEKKDYPKAINFMITGVEIFSISRTQDTYLLTICFLDKQKNYQEIIEETFIISNRERYKDD